MSSLIVPAAVVADPPRRAPMAAAAGSDPAAGGGPAAGQGPAADAADGACLLRPAEGPGDAGGVPGPRTLAEIDLEARYHRVLLEIDYHLEVGQMTVAQGRREYRQARERFYAQLGDLLNWQAAMGC